jgi:glycerol-3-phosphate dehydrogenase
MTREEQLQTLRSRREWPVLIVGGGINGVGVLRDLALQGIDALLVTKGDFSEGATAGSSRMIHGGLRYLEQAEFRLVQESLAERNHLLQHARHYVKPLRTTIPVFSWLGGLKEAVLKMLRLGNRTGKRGALWVKIGLSFYDYYVRHQRVVPKHHFTSASASLREVPQLNPDIKCTAVYHDAWVTYPERLCHEVVRDARSAHPVLALNHVSASGIDSGKITLRCEVTGESFEVKPQVVVNATGAWIDETNGKLGQKTEFIGGTKGSHLVLDYPELHKALDGQILYENPEGRVCLVFPFHDRVIVGSTDIPVASPDEARCDEKEVDYILASAKGILPGFDFNRSRIVSRFCAVRPLPRSNAGTTGQVSRDHSCRLTEPVEGRPFPIYSLIGGKWTTFRAFSEQVADRVLKDLGKSRIRSTAEMDIGGGRGMPESDQKLQTWIQSQKALSALAAQRREELVHRYGTCAVQVAEFVAAGDDQPLANAPGYTRREIEFLCECEDVVRLDDVLMRRTSLAILGRLTPAGIQEIAEICAAKLGWTPARIEEEKARSFKILQDELGITFNQPK